jgi:Tol biopolymer transport system component
MGEVYRARDARLGREVALKVLPEEVSADRDRLARFEQEARSASALNHPNIVTIHDIGQSGSVSYIAMELVDGQTLREIVVEGPMPVRRIFSIAPQIAEGLAKAHTAGIVHRDLKPENVMVSKDGYVKILDFGLSKLVAPASGGVSAMPTLARPETHPGTVLGTVAYMSPEQAGGRAVDYRSDQFSLGSILYEMAAGEKAFRRDSAAETMSAIIREDPEPLARASPKAPPPLRWIIERCLAKDPEERYASTRDLARDLAGVRDHISEVTSGAEASAVAAPRGKRRLLPILAGAGLLLLGALTHSLLAPGSAGKSAAPSFRRLTFRHGSLQNARFAPDGRTILYGATWEGEPSRLYQASPESPESRSFDFGADHADILAISSSGEMAILLNEAGYSGGVLARVPITGGTPRRVLEDVSYAGADWAPDGKDLVVARQSGLKQHLEYPIGRALTPGDAGSPRFSPDGKLIAFFEDVGTQAVSVIDPSGKNRRILSQGWASLQGAPGWRPDGREIWFTASKEAGQPEAIHGVTLSGKVRLVLRVPGILELDDVSRDGIILAAHHTIARAVMGRSLSEEKERNLSWLDLSDPEDISADGKTLVLTESGEGSGPRPTVYLRATDGSPAVKLGEGKGMSLSPDGKWVLAAAGEPGKPRGLILLPTGAGQSRPLPGGQFVDYGGAAFFPDGKRIVFAAQKREGPWGLYVQNLESGDPRPIGPEGFRLRPGSRLVSPDGHSVVGSKGPGKASLIPADGGEARPLAGLEARDVPLCWSADGRSLYVREGGALGTPAVAVKIWQLDPASGLRRLFSEIRLSEPTHPEGNFLLAPEAKTYVYSSTKDYAQLYLIEGVR